DDAFLDQRVLEKVSADLSRPRINLHADLEIGIGWRAAAEHDLFLTLRQREQFQSLIVESEIELAFALKAQIFLVSAPLQRDRNFVFAIDREVMANARAAARTDRRDFIAVLLNQCVGNGVGLIRR